MSEIVVERDPAGAAPNARLNDCSAERQIELRYLNAVEALLTDASEHKSAHILANVFTWTLARIAVGHDSVWIAGDIVRRLGDHLCTLAERRTSQEESEQAREQDHQPH